MNKGKATNVSQPVGKAEVLKFGAIEDARSTLDQIVRKGAREMLQAALADEANAFLELNSRKVDYNGRRMVVRNGHKPSRELVTGAGNLKVRQPRVRDKSSAPENRVTFSSSILLPYLRRSKAIDELIPWLYRKGLSTGDFSEALQSLTGGPVDAVSATRTHVGDTLDTQLLCGNPGTHVCPQ